MVCQLGVHLSQLHTCFTKCNHKPLSLICMHSCSCPLPSNDDELKHVQMSEGSMKSAYHPIMQHAYCGHDVYANALTTHVSLIQAKCRGKALFASGWVQNHDPNMQRCNAFLQLAEADFKSEQFAGVVLFAAGCQQQDSSSQQCCAFCSWLRPVSQSSHSHV